MISITAEGKNISVFPASEPDRPVIYFNTFDDEGQKLFQFLQENKCPEFTLVAVSNLTWNHDMTPWEIPPISKNAVPCTGGANDYLRFMIEEIIPAAEKKAAGKPIWRGIAGYSLGGLFALYSLYQTDLFSRMACMSGSLWFPGIKEYIFSHKIIRKPDMMYFSLGDKESKTRNKFLKCVRRNTEEIQSYYKNKGINSVFHLNSGNHYKDALKRTASGILSLLNEPY